MYAYIYIYVYAYLPEIRGPRKKHIKSHHCQDTEQRLARAQDDLSQRSLDAAEALTELGEELAKACLGLETARKSRSLDECQVNLMVEPRQAQAQASEAELCRLRSLWGCLADPVSGRC